MRRITESPHRNLFTLVTVLILVPCLVLAAEKEQEPGKKKKQKKAAAAAKAKKEDTAKQDTAKQDTAKQDAAKQDEAASKTTVTGSTPPAANAPAVGTAPAGDKPVAHPVTRGPLKIDLTLSGNLEANQMTEVAIVPKQWAQLTVAEAIPAGTRVNKGDTLLKLDTTKIDEAIRDLEATRMLAELGLKQAVEHFKLLEKSMPLDVQLAERTKKIAEQDYDWFVKVDAPQSLKSAAFALKASEQNLEYVTEELKQLEKMYKADDLTEETEEIILKRAKNDVDRSLYLTEQARQRHERSTTLDIPRTAEFQAQTLQQALLTWEKSRLNLAAQFQKQKLELDKMQFDHNKATDKLAELKRDRELLTITAPASGVVHYGRSQNGKWITASTMAQKYRPGNQVMPYEALFTIVSEGNWTVRSTVPEKDVASVNPGLVGRVKLAAYPKSQLPVKIRSIASVPNTDGSFDVDLDVLGPSQVPMVSGMSGEVKLRVYFSADAITIPTKAIFSDDQDDEKQFVYAMGPQGKPEKRSVTSGRTKDDMTEVVTGLNVGDSILLQKPTP